MTKPEEVLVAFSSCVSVIYACGVWSPTGYVCTLEVGHASFHVAHGHYSDPREILEIWE